MTVSATVLKRGRKFGQVLEGARAVFLSDGYEGASVDDIARVAGVSKATLYSYFPDKRLLFIEVAKGECRRQAGESLNLIDLSAPPAVVLRDAAHRMMRFILSEFGQRVFRICVAESDRFPELGRDFYESGPALVRARIITYLTCAQERGEVNIADFDLAADQFAALCRADLFDRMIFGIERDVSEADMSRVIEGAVDLFMARYGCRP